MVISLMGGGGHYLYFFYEKYRGVVLFRPDVKRGAEEMFFTAFNNIIGSVVCRGRGGGDCGWRCPRNVSLSSCGLRR